jgi:iron complex outermembrane receptor protein
VTLAPERSRNAELSIAYQRGAVFSKFTVFDNQIDDYIYLRDSPEMDHDDDHDHGSLILGNYVQSDARFTGFEFEVGTEFELPLGLIRVSLGRDQTKAEFDDGTYVPRISPARNLLEIEGNFGQFDASIRYQDVGRQNRTAQNELATAGYESLNMSLSTTLDLGSVSLRATLFGRNLLDDIARRHTSFVKEQAPLPGRNIGLKLTLRR